MLTILTLFIVIATLVFAYRYGQEVSSKVGMSNEEVRLFNSKLSLNHDKELDNLRLTFKNDFNASILQFRKDITEQYEEASRNITSL